MTLEACLFLGFGPIFESTHLFQNSVLNEPDSYRRV
jgi:hypothetical protein